MKSVLQTEIINISVALVGIYPTNRQYYVEPRFKVTRTFLTDIPSSLEQIACK
jgi:hypothetical protein